MPTQRFLKLKEEKKQAILEAAPNHVQFETENSIYTIAFFNQPETDANLIA